MFIKELLRNFSYVKIKTVARGNVKKTDIKTFAAEGTEEKALFSETFGMWADRDIDIKKIRNEIRERRTKNYDNVTL